MALIITPGPISDDGTTIEVESELTNFVNNTMVTNFDITNWEGAPISFVISSTDAPATESRTRGTMWFERGRGRLRQWFYTLNIDGTDNSEALGMWRDISDSKEMPVRVELGFNGVGRLLRKAPLTGVYSSGRLGAAQDQTQMMIMAETSITPLPLSYIAGHMLLSATENLDGYDRDTRGVPVMATEMGFGWAQVGGNGPVLYLSAITEERGVFGDNVLIATSPSLSDFNHVEVGVLAESSGSEMARQAKVFLRPEITNICRGEYEE